MRLLRYERQGRRYDHADEGKPRTFTWRSRIGERNVDIGQTFAPYALSGAVLRFGDSECEFGDGFQALRRLGQVIASRSRIFIQRETSPGVWADVPHGAPTRNVAENYPREGRATAYLDFPDIQGYAQGARFQAGIEVGGSDKATWGYRMRSPVAGTFRLEWVIDVPGNVELSWLVERTSVADPTPVRVGGKIGPLLIRWRREESPYRSATVEDDGQGGKTIRVILGPYALAAQEWLTVYPDTWGTDVPIAADADDGNEDADSTWYVGGAGGSGNAYVGEAGGNQNGGMRWTGVTLSGTIDTCYIDINQINVATPGTVLTKWQAYDIQNPGQFSGATRPSTVSRTTAAIDDDFAAAGSGTHTSPNLASIVQELLTSYGFDNEAINFCWMDDGSASGVVQVWEDYSYSGTVEPELTITYSASAPILTQTQFQFFDDGDELPNIDEPVPPVVEAGDVTESYNNTASGSWDTIARPAQATGDLIIMHLVSDANVTHGTLPGGPNGETAVVLMQHVGDAATASTRSSIWYWIATGANAAGNVTVTPSADEQWRSAAIRVLAGEFDPSTPIEWGNQAVATTGEPNIPAFTPTWGYGRAIGYCGVDADNVTGSPAGWTHITGITDRGAMNLGIGVCDTPSVASTEIDGGNFTGVNDGWVAAAYLINAPTHEPVADGRTPLDVAGTDPTLEVDTDYGVSIRVENSGAATTEDTYKWQYKKNAGSWTDITSSSSVVKAAATADFVNGADVPEYIGGSETYVTGNNAALDTTGSLTLDAVFGANKAFETHLNFQIVGADVADEDVIYLRIVEEDGTALDSYGTADTNIPAITVNKAGDVYSGSAAMGGGGAAAGTGAKGGKGTATVAAAGALAAIGFAAMLGLSVLSGGGEIAASGGRSLYGTSEISAASASIITEGAKGGLSQATAEGGGGLAATGIKTGQSPGAIAGGGTAAAEGTKAASGESSISGAGAIVADGEPGAVESYSESASMSGAGAMAATGEKGGLSAGEVSAGGAATTLGTKGGLGLGTASVGGGAEALGAKGAKGTASVSGGGGAEATGTAEEIESHSGPASMSGGGGGEALGFKDGQSAGLIAGAGAGASAGTKAVSSSASASGGGEITASGVTLQAESGAAAISAAGVIEAYGVAGVWHTDSVTPTPQDRTVEVDGPSRTRYAKPSDRTVDVSGSGRTVYPKAPSRTATVNRRRSWN